MPGAPFPGEVYTRPFTGRDGQQGKGTGMTGSSQFTRREFLRRSATTLAGAAAAGSLLAAVPAWATPRPRNGVLVRRNVKDLTTEERQDYVNAVLALKQAPSPYFPNLTWYDQFVWWHKQAFLCQISAAHMQPSFLPWHRLFLLMFEDALRAASGNAAVTIPYWDWTDDASTVSVFADDFMGPEGDPTARWSVTSGPFKRGVWTLRVVDPPANDPRRVRHLVRRFGTPIAPTLPTADMVARALGRPSYDIEPFDPGSDVTISFRNYLEGWKHFEGMTCEDGLMNPVRGKHSRSIMHNGVHLWVGGVWTGRDGGTLLGTMTLNTSNNDPVFWLHHCNIDRIWDQWEQTHAYSYAPVSGLPEGQNLNDTMWPYRDIGVETTIADLLDIQDLGYTYA
jgi:tyrosinase